MSNSTAKKKKKVETAPNSYWYIFGFACKTVTQWSGTGREAWHRQFEMRAQFYLQHSCPTNNMCF